MGFRSVASIGFIAHQVVTNEAYVAIIVTDTNRALVLGPTLSLKRFKRGPYSIY